VADFYICLDPHTASGNFAQDLADGKWLRLTSLNDATSMVVDPVGGISSTTVQSALEELDAEKQPLDTLLTNIAGLSMVADRFIYGTGTDTVALATITAAARTLLDDTTVSAMLTTLGGLPLAGGTMTGDIVLAGDPSAALHPASKQYVDSAVNGVSANATRQTIMSGPVSSTTGLPSLFPASASGLSLTAQNVSTTAPLVVFAAGGFSTTGARNRIASATSNPTWQNLTDSATNYLYADIDANGDLSYGSTTTAPTYQWGGTYSTTSGAYTFNIAEMTMKVGNGSTASQVYRVFVGEAVTSGGNVTSTRAYAYGGVYDSGWTTTLSNAGVSVSHNIGADPSLYLSRYVVQCVTTDLNWAVGDTLVNAIMNSSVTEGAVPVYATRNGGGIPAIASHLAVDKTATTNAALTVAKWKYKFVFERGW
jgi:hypothetical protein